MVVKTCWLAAKIQNEGEKFKLDSMDVEALKSYNIIPQKPKKKMS